MIVKVIDSVKTCSIGIYGYMSIEVLKGFREFQPDITFFIQFIIGILTIIYLIIKIRKK